MKLGAIAAAALVALAAAPSARAKTDNLVSGTFIDFPSGQVPDFPTLQSVVFSHPEITTIVFAKGTYLYSAALLILGRTGLTLCGATGDPADVTLECSDNSAISIVESVDVTLRAMTIRSTAPQGAAVYAASVVSPEVESYVHDVSILSCNLEGYYGAAAATRARDFTLADCRLRVTQPNGAGLQWQDGEGIFVTRCHFTTAPGISATVALFVKGAQDPTSDGRRARHILITDNTVDGDYETGFDLADVVDARVRRNRIEFSDPQLVAIVGGNPFHAGRMGIVVRRAGASNLTEDFVLLRNVVHKAQYGIWLVNAGSSATQNTKGRAIGNDLRECGAPTADDRFGDTGGAMRLNLGGGPCPLVIEHNDLRDLASPSTEPAVAVFPPGRERTCLAGTVNRVDRGRAL